MKLFRNKDSKPPKGGKCIKLVTKDGAVLRTALWHSDAVSHKGTVCILHGRIEFIEKYYEVVSELLSRGFSVATLDWRGQGGSDRLIADPLRGHVENFDDYLMDLKSFMEEIVLPECKGPFYALAHSMGGHILLRALADHNWFERSVAISPMVGIALPKYSESFVGVLVDSLSLFGLRKKYVPSTSYIALVDEMFAGNFLTSDRKRFERTKNFLIEHPNLVVGAPTNGWLSAALSSVERLEKENYPLQRKRSVLIISAGLDRVVSNRAIDRFTQRIPGASQITIEGSRHEILMEKDSIREQFWSAFDAFIPGSDW